MVLVLSWLVQMVMLTLASAALAALTSPHANKWVVARTQRTIYLLASWVLVKCKCTRSIPLIQNPRNNFWTMQSNLRPFVNPQITSPSTPHMCPKLLYSSLERVCSRICCFYSCITSGKVEVEAIPYLPGHSMHLWVLIPILSLVCLEDLKHLYISIGVAFLSTFPTWCLQSRFRQITPLCKSLVHSQPRKSLEFLLLPFL